MKSNGSKSFRSATGPNRMESKPEPFPTCSVVLNDRSPGVRRERCITKSEIQDRRRHGLCFHCDKKFTIGHRCKKEFNILLVHEEIGMEDLWAVEDTRDAVAPMVEKVQISLNSLVDLTYYEVERGVRGKDVIVLVNCGATHNFISWELVRRMGIPFTETIDYGVETGTGESVQGKGICRDVVLNFVGIHYRGKLLASRIGQHKYGLGNAVVG